ncbi:hypothetical protein BDD12DRAFT_725895 [Trichophaea hybrida]|nr:hypothetical protein BDD12DRAFT_725895 [Trichophaea hybrida]
MRVPQLLLFLLLLFATCILAQNTSGGGANTRPATSGDNKAAATSQKATSDNLPKASTAAKTTSTPTEVATTPTDSGSQNTDLPATDAPLPKASDDRGYTIPVITPPPTKGAPFMQPSNLPEGTVFIAVGAALALCALVILAWRGLVAWSLHRSVKRATTAPGVIDSKSMLRPHKGGQGGGFYAAGAGSMHSLDHLASSNSRLPAAPPPGSSLFFSPTSNTGPPLSVGGDRRSTYLPPGLYSAGNRKSAVPSINSQTHFTRPLRGSGVSPPGTPLMAPMSRRASSSGTERMVGMRVNDSQTSLNAPPTTGRAPSAYLEDLFESHPIPEQQHPSQRGGRF